MLLILPVDTLLLYTTLGVTSYTFFTWLLFSSPYDFMIGATHVSLILSAGTLLLLGLVLSELEDVPMETIRLLSKERMEEVRELLAKDISPPPLEETTEFADLLS